MTARALVAASVAVALAACSGEAREPKKGPRWEAPHVELKPLARESHIGVGSITVEARLIGEPTREEDWLCITPTWWVGDARLGAGLKPEKVEWCGETEPAQRRWKQTLSVTEEYPQVNVILWSRAGKQVASRHAVVAPVAIR